MCILLDTDNISKKKIALSLEQHKKAFLHSYFEKVHQLDEMMIADGIFVTLHHIYSSQVSGITSEDFQIMSDKWAACICNTVFEL